MAVALETRLQLSSACIHLSSLTVQVPFMGSVVEVALCFGESGSDLVLLISGIHPENICYTGAAVRMVASVVGFTSLFTRNGVDTEFAKHVAAKLVVTRGGLPATLVEDAIGW